MGGLLLVLVAVLHSLITSAAGMAFLLVGGLTQTVLFNGDFPGTPILVVPGLLGLMIGFVLIGVFFLRLGVLPRWLGIVLVGAAVLLLVANEQTAAVLSAIPFGLAMAAVGFFMGIDRSSVGDEAHGN